MAQLQGPFPTLRSMKLCVPLVASQQTLGLLSVGHTEPNAFTQDHVRRTQLLAIPAAAAIQNSRLYERAEIYGSELQRRLTDLRQTENALEQSEEARRLSEDKFSKRFSVPESHYRILHYEQLTKADLSM